MSLAKKITPADEYFVSLVTEGHMKNMDAYLLAFPHYKERTDNTNNTELCYYLKTPKIAKMIQEYRAEVRERCAMSLEYMIDKCRAMADDETTRNTDRIKAMELAAKLQGMFEKRVTLQGGLNMTHDITPEMSEALDDLLR